MGENTEKLGLADIARRVVFKANKKMILPIKLEIRQWFQKTCSLKSFILTYDTVMIQLHAQI